MNKYRKYLLPVIISVLLCILPFFWLKPGWMDLGGDASRLYFYDPFHYLQSLPLYGITPGGVGTEVTGYFLIPYILFLWFLKSIVISPTVLISLMNSITLVVAFGSVFLIVKELIEANSKYADKIHHIVLAGSIAGIMYIFSPMLISSGWSKALYVHNNVFLNPLLFFLGLRFLHTQKRSVLLWAVFISVVFAPNFFPSPYFFSFFPFAVSFFIFYAVVTKRTANILKKVLLALALFIGMHLFHLLPMFLNFFSANSAVYNSTFTGAGKFIRGLSYFLSVSETTNITSNIFLLAQGTSFRQGLSFLQIVFPSMLVIGLLLQTIYKEKREYIKSSLLLLGFLLISFFFISAKVTGIGFLLYKTLFTIPGFAMFRNFVGQFSHTYVLFFVIVFGLSIFQIFVQIQKKYQVGIAILLFAIIVVQAVPFIRGDMIHYVMNPSGASKVTVPFKMDPLYEKILDEIRKHPIDARYITFPLTYFGYQMFAGKNGGAYQGPSTLAYLAGKKDFSGYQEFTPYNDILFRLIKNKDYDAIKNLFSLLNIKYIFYNSDEYIYGPNFPTYPYQYVKEFLPTQQAWKDFIEKLGWKKTIQVGDYSLYSAPEEAFSPHFYTTKEKVVMNNLLELIIISDLPKKDVVFLPIQQYNGETNHTYLEAINTTTASQIINNYHLHTSDPFVAHGLMKIYYPFVPMLEQYQLKKVSSVPDQYVDNSLLLASKRINELSMPKTVKLFHAFWKRPNFWEVYKWQTYNSWEASFARYEEQVKQLIAWIDSTNQPDTWKDLARIKVNEQLFKHQKRVYSYIQEVGEDQAYVYALAKRTFDALFSFVDAKLIDPGTQTYEVEVPKGHAGTYELLLQDKESPTEFENIIFALDGKMLNDSKQPLFLSEGMHTIKISVPLENIATEVQWHPAVVVDNSNNNSSTTFKNSMNSFDNAYLEIKQPIPGSQYAIAFDYMTNSEDFLFKFYDVTTKKDGSEHRNMYFEKLLNSKTWKRHQSIVTTIPTSDKIVLQIQSNNNKVNSTVLLRNVSVVALPQIEKLPQLIFKKTNEAVTGTNTPSIMFTKVNPTKYRVSVYNSKGPYQLVFAEAFSNNWKVYLNDNSVAPHALSKTNGQVKEGKHTNTFLDLRTFETYFMKNIADNRHYLANGYANAWEILPEDTSNKASYELIVELQSQQRFYIALAISVTCVLICIWLMLVDTLSDESAGKPSGSSRTK